MNTLSRGHNTAYQTAFIGNTLDTTFNHWHDESVAAKSAASFGRLKPNGSHAAKTSRFFCVCNISLQLFLWAAEGGRLYACWLRLASLPTCLLSSAPTFGSVGRALTQTKEVHA